MTAAPSPGRERIGHKVGGMDLAKGQNVVLGAPGDTAVRVSWTGGPTVDVSALLLNQDGKVRSDADFVFYGQPQHPSGSVRHTGGAAGGDGLQIQLPAVEADVERIVIGASAEGRPFGEVSGLVIEVGSGGAVHARYVVEGASSETAFLLGELYRRSGAWRFRAIGQGYDSGLAGFATDFGVDVEDGSAAGAPPAAAPVSLKKQKLIEMEKRLGTEAPRLLDLTKRAAVSLEKRGLGEHTARVALCLDISASMDQLYRSGKIQALVERVLALGLRFDDNGQVDVFLFGAGGHEEPAVALANHASYVPDMIRRRRLEAGTRYGAAMRLIRKRYFGADGARTQPFPDAQPVYVMFVTDGAPMDRKEAEEQLRFSSYEPVFWQFMAIGKSNRAVDAGETRKRGLLARIADSQFAFLEQLDDLSGRHLDNADFFGVTDPANLSDDQLYDLLMTEYPGWLEAARRGGLLTA
jgi:stress response protein SCP2